jgi:hypothetical protein
LYVAVLRRALCDSLEASDLYGDLEIAHSQPHIGHSLDHSPWVFAYLVTHSHPTEVWRVRKKQSTMDHFTLYMYVMYDSIANIFTANNTLGKVKILGLKEYARRRKLGEEFVQSYSIDKHICLLSKRCGNKLLVLVFQTQTVPVIMWQPKISYRRTIIITGLPNQT